MQIIQLSIPEPCQENWQQMDPSEKGRFCNACAREVVDFSTMTDNELLHYFSKKGGEKVCGRMYPDQLNRAITLPTPVKHRKFRYWNYAAACLFLFSKSSVLKAQIKSQVVTVPVQPGTCNVKMGKMVRISEETIQPVIVSGKVLNEKGDPLIYAMVRVISGKTGTTTNKEGKFKLTVSPNDRILQVSALGYKAKEYILNGLETGEILLKLALEPILLGEIIISGCRSGECNYLPDIRSTAQFKVIDEASGLPLANSKIVYSKSNSSRLDSGITDRKGVFKLRHIINSDLITAKVTAEGYLENNVEINAMKFTQDKEKVLVKMARESVNKTVGNTNNTVIRIGGVRSVRVEKVMMLVVDDVVFPAEYLNNLNPPDIKKIEVIKSASAVDLYGLDASKGVLVITTKGKEKNVSAKILKDSISDTLLHKIATKVSDVFSLNRVGIYPNPVQKGGVFFISMQKIQAGDVHIQISNSSGIVLMKLQSVSQGREFLEKIQTDQRWANGIFYLSVFNNSNKLIGRAGFVIH